MSSLSLSNNGSANDDFFEMMQKMLNGQLDEGETELVLMLMEQSEENLEAADALWAEHLAVLEDAPNLDAERTKRIEAMIDKRIHQADLGSELFKVTMQAIPNVWFALLRPLLSHSIKDTKRDSHGDKEDGK